MSALQIEIKLLSETIFGSGETVSNFVDNEVLHDDYGIPYMKGKTFKGKLREEVEEIGKLIQSINNKSYTEIINGLFGEKGSYSISTNNVLDTLKFSNCEISKNIRELLINSVNKKLITKEEILSSFTEVRSFTEINKDGIATEGSLRQSRVVKRDLIYYVDINVGRSLSNVEKGLIAAGVSALRNIGAMESRGKGRVKCRLLEEGKDVTIKYISKLEDEVK